MRVYLYDTERQRKGGVMNNILDYTNKIILYDNGHYDRISECQIENISVSLKYVKLKYANGESIWWEVEYFNKTFKILDIVNI